MLNKKTSTKIQFNVLHMMSNVAWPKWKIYYGFFTVTLQCLFKGKTNLGKEIVVQRIVIGKVVSRLLFESLTVMALRT